METVQRECPDLRRVHASLSSGTRPTSKNTKITQVKRYLKNVVINRDGLLVIIKSEPFLPQRELIVVPQHIAHGLVNSLHLRLNHPSPSQLLKVFQRSFFALKPDQLVSDVDSKCSMCQSLKKIPREQHEQSSTDFPTSPCKSFAIDVMRRFKQKLYILRDTFSSFTTAIIIDDETSDTLRSALITSISSLRASPQTKVIARVDNAPGFKSLNDDSILKKNYITLDFGRKFNKNKNPVIDKGILELHTELLKYTPEGGPVSALNLAIVLNYLNSRIRNRGLSSWEMLFQRDQLNQVQLDIPDATLSKMQQDIRIKNQKYSAISKARGGPIAKSSPVCLGSIVFIKDDGDKTRARDKYLIVDVNGEQCTAQKLLKSSLSSRKYCLKRSEIYPISSDENYITSLRGIDPVVSEEEEEEQIEDIENISNCHSLPSCTPHGVNTIVHEPPQMIDRCMDDSEVITKVPEPLQVSVEHTDIPVSPSPCDMDHSAEVSSEASAVVVSDSLRRSNRPRRKPPWMSVYVE